MNFGPNDHYLECIKSAYDFASGELLNLMKDKVHLLVLVIVQNWFFATVLKLKLVTAEFRTVAKSHKLIFCIRLATI